MYISKIWPQIHGKPFFTEHLQSLLLQVICQKKTFLKDSYAIPCFHPTTWLKDFLTLCTDLVTSHFVEDLPVAVSETYKWDKKSRACVHKVWCAYIDNPFERPEKLFNFYVTFLIFVKSAISVLLIPIESRS